MRIILTYDKIQRIQTFYIIWEFLYCMAKRKKDDKSRSSNPNPQKENSQLLDYAKGIIITVLGGLVLGIVTVTINYLYQLIPPTIDYKRIFIIVGIAIIVTFVTTLLIIFKLRSTRLKKSELVSVVFIFAIVITCLCVYVVIAHSEQPTRIFIIDATIQSSEAYDEIIAPFTNIKSHGSDVDYLGLTVYGGGYSDQRGTCEDIYNPVDLELREEAEREMRESLPSIVPSGQGSMIHATLQTIDLLEGRRGVQGITIITSGINNGCDSITQLLSAEVYNYAQEKGIELDLEVIIPPQISITSETRETLEIFSGKLLTPEDQQDYHELIQERVDETPLSIYQRYYQGQND